MINLVCLEGSIQVLWDNCGKRKNFDDTMNLEKFRSEVKVLRPEKNVWKWRYPDKG